MSINEKKFKETNFKTKFGSLIKEFKLDKGLISSLYYPLFLLRRLEYVVTQIFLNEYPLIQVCLNTSFTFVILIFLLFYRPFTDKTAFIALFTSEICVFIVFFCSGFFIYYDNSEMVFIIESICIYSILASVCVQTIISIYNFIIQARLLYKKIDKKRALQFVNNASQVSQISEN